MLEHPGPISFGAPIRHFHPAPPLQRRAAQDPNFDKPTLRQSIARLNHTSDADIETALEEGFRQELARVAQDGLISRDEEEHLRAFRDRLALQDNSADRKALQTLDQASQDHLTIEARLATTAVRQDDQHLQELSLSVQQADLDEEETHGGLVQAAVIRDVTQGIVPQRQAITGAIPFNLMKSEQLVWVLQDVDYLETVVRRERRGSSHGLSIRVALGVYYRPSTFRSRPIEWEETIHADTGLLGLTTKHLYFAGARKKFRVRYDRIVSFDPYDDGFGIMRDAQSAKPQTFRTGDGWFAYNLAANLAQM